MNTLFKTSRFPTVIFLSFSLINCGGGDSDGGGNGGSSATQITVGKKLFFDENLSSEGNQSCASCHSPAKGFADPRVSKIVPVSEGSGSGDFGNRNAPTAAYASFIPTFTQLTTQTDDNTVSNYQGGQFLDGRAADLVEQAKGPFLNPVEMKNVDKADVVTKVQSAIYANEFKEVFGDNVFDNTETAYDNIATAIAAFERSSELQPFSSKFDAVMEGTASFTASEEDGFELFKGDAKCANCHTVNDPADRSIFSDFNYFNIGTPKNPDNPVYDNDIAFIDGGLGDRADFAGTADETQQKGKFRTPTLRNIACTGPYMHNGVYATLREIITHYDLTVANHIAAPFPALFEPEVDLNIAEELKVGLGLDPDDYDDLESFLNTLSDGYPSSICN